MAKRRRYPKLPNGYGAIKRLSGRNRTNPYGVYPSTKEFDENGIPVAQKAICYVDDWYKAFTVLTWCRNGEYYDGRERELSTDADELKKQVMSILSGYNQNKRDIADKKTFTDVYMEYYLWKFGKEFSHKEKKSSMESSMRAAYKNCSQLHGKPFCALTTADLQTVVDACTLKHSSLELIVTLFHQMYAYAEANDLCDKDYSKYVKIKVDDDDEHGEPFTDADLKILWDNKEDPVVEMILIMCYSGFRISAYKNLETNFEELYFKGGVKTKAGKNRVVPIHPAILPLVTNRIKQHGERLLQSDFKFRLLMYDMLESLGIDKHTPHDCRHTFSRLCDKYGVRENDKKIMLGHSFQDVTNKVYLHRGIEDLRAQLEKIEACH